MILFSDHLKLRMHMDYAIFLFLCYYPVPNFKVGVGGGLVDGELNVIFWGDRTCAYQGVRNVSFSGNIAYLLNG